MHLGKFRHGRQPARYPWEWGRALRYPSCPVCATLAPAVKPSRRRFVLCRRCGTLFNTLTGRVRELGGPIEPPGEGTSGMREPRRPAPFAGSGAVALPLPDTDPD